jgi:hypothetical protein
MVSSLGYNPIITSNASGSFNIESAGYIQGQALDAPAARFEMAGGILATDENLPMWGGVGIYENIPGVAAGPSTTLGGIIGRATSIAAPGQPPAAKALTGFSTFDQAHHMVQTPQSEVPVALSGMSVNFYRFGSRARLAVAIDPTLITLQGEIITSQVSWDFINQKIIAPVAGSILPVTVLAVQATNCLTVQYAAATGFTTWNRNGACAIIQL